MIGLNRYNVVRNYITSNYPDFAGKEWERLCRHAVSGNTVFGITWDVASRWWGTVAKGKQIELDLVAESIDKKSLLIGECKWLLLQRKVYLRTSRESLARDTFVMKIKYQQMYQFDVTIVCYKI